jgi:hypothetical protein
MVITVPKIFQSTFILTLHCHICGEPDMIRMEVEDVSIYQIGLSERMDEGAALSSLWFLPLVPPSSGWVVG